jgi:hypothetical protein
LCESISGCLFPPLACGFQLVVAGIMNRLAVAFEHVLGRDVANGAVQALLVVDSYILLDEADGIVQAKRNTRTDALAFDRAVPAFQLPVGLRIAKARCECVSSPRCG